jgi:hypothetical protein
MMRTLLRRHQLHDLRDHPLARVEPTDRDGSEDGLLAIQVPACSFVSETLSLPDRATFPPPAALSFALIDALTMSSNPAPG